MGQGEIDLAGPLLRVGHPLEHVDLSGLQGLAHLRPAPQAELDLHPHDFGDGTGQLDVVAGRLAVLVEELVGRIIPVAADDDGRDAWRIGRSGYMQELLDNRHASRQAVSVSSDRRRVEGAWRKDVNGNAMRMGMVISFFSVVGKNNSARHVDQICGDVAILTTSVFS